jgi:polar amino acid transport system substrate-binding protein
MTMRSTLTFAVLCAATLAVAGPVHADALADIQKAGTIKVGVFADFPPFSSVGPDMKLKGYDIDVAEKLAAALHVKSQLVEVTGQNRIPYLNEHRVDVLMSVGKNPEREKVIAFTQAYAPYYIAVIGPKAMNVKGPADLADKTISVNRGTLEDTSLTQAAPKSADVRRFDNYSAVIQAFLSGQTQLMATGNDVGAQVLAKHTDLAPEQKFQLLSSPDHLAINKGEPSLLKALDEAIGAIKTDGTLDKVSTKWLGKPLDPKDLAD